MGYEFHIYKLSRPVASVREFSAEIVEPIAGDVASLMAALSSVEPRIRWRDTPLAAVGSLALGDDTLDFCIEKGASPPSEGLHISSHRGVVTACHPVVDSICRALGWTAVDLNNWRLLGANVNAATDS